MSQVDSKRASSIARESGEKPPLKKQRSRGENKTPPKPNKPTDDDIEGLQLSDMVTGMKEVEVKGKPVKSHVVLKVGKFGSDAFTVIQLRKICSLLSIKGYKNKSKALTLVAMATHVHNKKLYSAVYGDGAGDGDSDDDERPQRGPQCMFRLLNIIFHPQYHERFLNLGKGRSREELDGRVSPDSALWQEIGVAFLSDENDDIGEMLC